MGKVIASISEPTIQLLELELADFSYTTGSEALPEVAQKDIELRGVEYPHVQVNRYVFGPKEILKLSIDSTNTLPRLSMKAQLLTSGIFLSTSFPKDGDILSIFIRSRDDLLKPIRNDYLIISVETFAPASSTQEGKGNIISIEAELYIPNLYDEKNYAISGTSYEVIKELAKNLGLGFASNEDNTSDEMVWICGKDNYLEFLKHVCGSAWKDENSFFTFYIDVYYHLNFVNVNDLINYDADMLLALVEDTVSGGQQNFETTKKGIEEKCLTNHPGRIRSNFFVKKFKPVNNAQQLVKKYGYAFNAIFYDHDGDKTWQLQGKSLITPGAETQKIILRGRPDDSSYNTLQKYNYVGIQHNKPKGNVHENFYYARVHNMMNNIEFEKLTVEAIVNKFNFNIYRYENLPAVFVVTNDIKRMKDLNADGVAGSVLTDEGAGLAIDKFYTGHYLVKGLIINYAPTGDLRAGMSGFSESVILARREWPSPTGL